MPRFSTITDLAATIRDLAGPGIIITDDHVLRARHEAGLRYEDIDTDALDAIHDRAVALAIEDETVVGVVDAACL